MTEYGLIESGTFGGRLRDFDATPPILTHKNMEWRLYQRTAAPAYDPLTQNLIGPGHDVSPTEITQTWLVVNVDAAEATQRQDDADLKVLRQAGKDLALVLVELIEWQLANTTMQATDFSNPVKQAYLDLKAIADRLRAP